MPLTATERKGKMPAGAGRRIARRIGVGEPYISRVLLGAMLLPRTPRARKKFRRVQRAIAQEIGLPVDECFGPVPDRIEATPEVAA